MPYVATVVIFAGILALFALARDRSARTSAALWIPVVWLLISGSRNVGEWIHLDTPAAESAVDRYAEGNPIDQVALTGIEVLGVAVLIRRRRQVAQWMRANPAIVAFFLYCAVSMVWSDSPATTARRWIKSVGDIVMVLLVLTEVDRIAALRRYFSRAGYLLVPISILFIRYFPNLGRAYTKSWTMTWTGVAEDKNGLGMICLVFGVAALWQLLQAWAVRKTGPKGNRSELLCHAITLAMIVWLVIKADSATSKSCLAIGGMLMALVTWSSTVRRTALLHVFVFSVIAVTGSALFLQGTNLLGVVGRDSTLTGRTDLWERSLKLVDDPILGAGYEAFWTGPRLARVHREWPQAPNQAHNGYLEIYLNLGWVGVCLLVLVMLAGYRRIVSTIRSGDPTGTIALAFFVITLIYNCTEGAFKMMHPLWTTFLLCATAIPAASMAGTDKAVVTPPPVMLGNWLARSRTLPPAIVATSMPRGRQAQNNLVRH